MRVHILHPRNTAEGEYAESVAIFAARRCRTTKSYEDLWKEVDEYSSEKRRDFMDQVIFTDWAGDVLEQIHVAFDLEGLPMWLVVELFRHRLVMREFSPEQLSQRAINPMRLEMELSDQGLQKIAEEYVLTVAKYAEENKIPPEELREAFPQGVLVNMVIAGNLRAFHHFFFMRSSQLYSGKGRAHHKFMDIADEMQRLARVNLPIAMGTILQA